MINLRNITPFRIASALALCVALYVATMVSYAEDWYAWYVVVPLVFLALVLLLVDWLMRRFIPKTSILFFIQLMLLGFIVILYREGLR